MVAMNVWPTDAADGAVTSEARWRKMGRLWTPSGAAMVSSPTALLPSLAYPNLTIRAGACWVDGHFCELLGDQVLGVTPNGLAVVRFDPAANTAELLYRDGAATANQSPTGVWEMPVCRISGSAGQDIRTMLTTSGIAFATTLARDFNLPAATTPAGTQCVTTDTGITWTVIGGAWVGSWATNTALGMPFANGWSAFGGAFQIPQARKIGDIVYWRGLVKGGTPATSMFLTAPAFRPPADLKFSVITFGGIGELQVAANSSFLLASGSPTWASLDGVTYSTTA